jgi:hypothetical protein
MATATEPTNGVATARRREPSTSERARAQVMRSIVFCLIAVSALSALPVPFMGDQALFTLGGRALANGSTLYTGFWDMKQPAVFVFYRVAGGMFGYDEVGAHLLELAWQLALVALVLRVVRGRFDHGWLEPLAALFSVGFYYAIVTTQEMTQVESLAGLPVLLAVWLYIRTLDRGNGARNWRPIAAGAALFLVGFFKLMLVAVPVVCWVALTVTTDRASRSSVARRAASWIALGAIVPSAMLVAWAVESGAFTEMLRTWFQVPLGVPERAGRSTGELVRALWMFTKLFAPLLLLAAVGSVRALRRRDPVAQSMLAWLVVGFVLYALQLWWFYLLMLLVVPIGVLAAYGVDVLWSNGSRLPRRLLVVVAIAFVASCAFAGERTARRVVHLARHGFAVGGDNRRAFQFDESPRYEMIAREARVLRELPEHDTVVVWGDPLYLYLGEREQAIAMNGWAPEHLDHRLWRRAARELAVARPSVVFVEKSSAHLIDSRGPGVAAVLARDYAIVRRDAEGTWYRLAER